MLFAYFSIVGVVLVVEAQNCPRKTITITHNKNNNYNIVKIIITIIDNNDKNNNDNIINTSGYIS